MSTMIIIKQIAEINNFNYQRKKNNLKNILSFFPSLLNVFQHKFPDWQGNRIIEKCSCTVCSELDLQRLT